MFIYKISKMYRSNLINRIKKNKTNKKYTIIIIVLCIFEIWLCNAK